MVGGLPDILVDEDVGLELEIHVDNVVVFSLYGVKVKGRDAVLPDGPVGTESGLVEGSVGPELPDSGVVGGSVGPELPDSVGGSDGSVKTGSSAVKVGLF